jgi:tetratricopeptide (TPR) repeat protein
MTPNNASDTKASPNGDRERPNVRDDASSDGGYASSCEGISPTIRSASQTTLGHFLLARKLFQKGRYSLALGELAKVLHLNPELPTAHLLKGVISFKLAELDDARESLLTAVRLQDDLFQGWIALARVEHELGHVDDALKAITRAIKANPKTSAAYLIKGSLLEEMQRPANAAKAYREATRLNPKSKIAHYKLGSVLIKLGRNEEAERQILTAHRLSPTDRNSQIALGDLHLARGETDRAVDAYKAAADLDFKRSALPQAKLGEAYFRAGLLQEAAVSLQLAVRLDPKQAQAFLLLGTICMQLKQTEEAVRMFEAAVEIDPRLPEAQRLLDESQAAIRGRVDADDRPT